MTSAQKSVAFVDDDDDLCRATVQMLELAGFTPLVFPCVEAALASIDDRFTGPVITDIRMPGTNGLQLFSQLQAIDADIPVIIVTGHGDVDLAVTTLKDGAYDFITKPFTNERLIKTLHRAAEMRDLALENRRLKEAIHAETGHGLIGETAAIKRIRETLRLIADVDIDVLIEGETGSGKEVVANLLHNWSGRHRKPFVAVNCGALPESVIESELFGYEAGAFTGARQRRIGRIEHANGGTLFLDEIESMPLALQVKLLRVLETRQVEPLGTNEKRQVDLRVVAATKIDLSESSARKDFREDLYFRLNVMTLRIPPLRERRDDIPLLFGHFMRNAAQRFGRPAPELTKSIRDRLFSHDWPGNVRELLHFAQRAVLGLEPSEPKSENLNANETLSLAEKVDHFEGELIREALSQHHGDVQQTIKALRLPRKTFYDKLKRHRISRAHYDLGDC